MVSEKCHVWGGIITADLIVKLSLILVVGYFSDLGINYNRFLNLLVNFFFGRKGRSFGSDFGFIRLWSENTVYKYALECVKVYFDQYMSSSTFFPHETREKYTISVGSMVYKSLKTIGSRARPAGLNAALLFSVMSPSASFLSR